MQSYAIMQTYANLCNLMQYYSLMSLITNVRSIASVFAVPGHRQRRRFGHRQGLRRHNCGFSHHHLTLLDF